MAASVKIVRSIPSSQVLERMDRPALFRDRWQFGRTGSRRKLELEMQLLRKWSELGSKTVWSTQAVYGLFPARIEKCSLVVFPGGKTGRRVSLDLSKRYGSKLLENLPMDRLLVGMQVVTLGRRAAGFLSRIGQQGSASERFLWHGLAAEATEAATEWCQERMTKRLGGKKTIRLSPGYPAWPQLAEQRKLFSILRPERIGVRLTEALQMIPEYSTSALVLSC